MTEDPSALSPPKNPGKRRSRVGVIDDHTMMREGVKLFLDNLPDFECAWIADSANAGIAHLEADPPDVLIVDLTLPDRHGIQFVKDAHALCPSVPVLIHSMHDEHAYAPRALKAGAKGYLMKDVPNDVFANALRRVVAGGFWLNAEINDEILAAFATGAAPGDNSELQALTDRERELFELIGEGMGTNEIADAMHISTKTVDVHRSNIRTKLQLPDGPALLRYAVQWVEARNSGSRA